MSRLILPTIEEIIELGQIRSDICLSIFIETSPLKTRADRCRLELAELIRQSFKFLDDSGHDQGRLGALARMLNQGTGDEDFCLSQARGLAILASPEMIRMFRLGQRLDSRVEIADRFYLRPLLKALTSPESAYVLVLSENNPRIMELRSEDDPGDIYPAVMPIDSPEVMELGGEPGSDTDDRKRRLVQYARQIDAAVRPLARSGDQPVILAAGEPLASIFRAVSNICLAEETIAVNPETVSPTELASLAKPVLDDHKAREKEGLKALFDYRAGQRRVAVDLADAARAATFGLISLALVDFEQNATGYIDDNGLVTFSSGPESYGVIDEIAKRTLENGGRIMNMPQKETISRQGIAAILRYPL